MESKTQSFIKQFAGKHIFVIGDIMLDRFLMGTVNRISPEAPVPVVHIKQDFLVAGGAANVAVNIKTLGGEPILVGMIGDDAAGKDIVRLLRLQKLSVRGLLYGTNRVTTEKTRLVALHQQIARIDREDSDMISKKIELRFLGVVKKYLPMADGVIISDYSKGLITPRIARFVIDGALKRGIPVVVDSKPKSIAQYQRATVVTPNHHEAQKMTGTEDVRAAARAIHKILASAVLVTQGADGMTLFEQAKFYHIAALAREVVDTVGAGDTVVAALALALSAGADLLTGAKIANAAAGIVVGKSGTAHVVAHELYEKI